MNPKWQRRIAVPAHICLVAFLGVLLVAVEAGHKPEDGANIGAGLVALPLLGLGLPWSLATEIIANASGGSGLPPGVPLLLVVGPAALNVGVHWMVWRRRWRELD